ALGRHAAARGDRARAGGEARDPADGRAVRRARRADAHRAAGRDLAAAAGDELHGALHHAQRRGGGVPWRSRRRDVEPPGTHPPRHRDSSRRAVARPRDRGRQHARGIHSLQARDLGADPHRDRAGMNVEVDTTRRNAMKLATKMAALAAALVACAITAAPAAAQEPVRMVLMSQANEAGFPLWLANKLGYFKERGIDAKIQYFPNGGAALASGASGDWQAGWIGAPPAITGWAKFGLIPVGTMMKEDRNIKLIMRKDALKGSSPKDVLQTKPIGTVPNSTWSQVLFACAKHFGVDPARMKIVPLEPPVTRQSLHSGQVASGTTDSSPDYDLVNDKANFEVVCDGKVAGKSVVDPYIVTRAVAQAHPDVAAKFVDAVYRANELVQSNRDQAVKYLLEYYKDVG